ncbi:Protein MOTHER of FT and TF 1 [Platanthera guangdongensis]|uniref:Protein MOTHER of FT and TF 1 n=1 Tax=Platanthera guangdongensis TaxID=2320717 RepID=A0ABR2LGJ0_9ASPA
MTTYVDPLVVGGVIGDVIDLFVPMVTMSVHFGSKHINNGCEITPSLAANLPTVNISGRRFDRFTLVGHRPITTEHPSSSDLQVMSTA